MPKELTHWIMAERALEGLGGAPLAETIRPNHSLYLAGSVLPDTLLHLFRGADSGAALRLADRFHDPEGNGFAPFIGAEAAHGAPLPPPLLACLLGVISHMVADATFHPWVYSQCDSSDMGLHYRLETAMDVHFLQLTPPPARRLAELITDDGRVLVDAMAMLFDPGGELPRDALERALSLHCRFQGMYDRFWWKLAALLLGSLPGSPVREKRQLFYPLDPAGRKHRRLVESVTRWRHPVDGDVRHSSLDDLAAIAVQETIATFERIQERGTLAAALESPPGANLLTGKAGVTMARMKSPASTRS